LRIAEFELVLRSEAMLRKAAFRIEDKEKGEVQ